MTRKRGHFSTFLVFTFLFTLTFLLNSGKTIYLYPQGLLPQVEASSTNYSSSVVKKSEVAVTNNVKIPPTQTARVSFTSDIAESLTGRRSKMSLYMGPGAITAHTNFELWLGIPIPYATDYIDFKGGWQKDFVDSKTWLMEPWGKWVRAAESRKLVLGVPMLEKDNYGQFAEATRGGFDAYYSSLASQLVSQKLDSSILRIGYEANCDTIGPWQATNDPGGYKLLFRHIVTVMKSVPGSNFLFDWTVCNGLQTGKALNTFDSFYPGNDVVDMIGTDIYDVKWKDTNVTPEQRWDYAMNQNMGVNDLLSFARTNNKTVSYPEWGLYKPGDNFSGGGDNSYFIDKMTELINATSPAYQSYFNVNWGGGILHDFINGETLFKSIYGR